MREASRPRGPRGTNGVVALRLTTGLAAAALALSACAGDAREPATSPGESAAASGSASSEATTVSPSPTTSPEPDEPNKPRFREGRAGKRAFVAYIVDGWGYALQTNDPSVLIKASGRKPCRGCDSLRRELRKRAEEGWYVKFPGAKVRKVTFRPDGPVEVATAVVDVPESQSFFDDGTFRNDNKARKKVKFLLDIRADGRGKQRRWTLLAFSIK
jgi:hypothetical protein